MITTGRKLDRKTILKILSAVLTLLPLGLVVSLIERYRKTASAKKTILAPLDLNEGVSFLGGAIIFKNKDSMRVMSSKCTHLGCVLDKTTNGKIVCHCHGSEFDFSGRVLAGPAARDLDTLPWKIDAKAGKIVIEEQG